MPGLGVKSFELGMEGTEALGLYQFFTATFPGNFLRLISKKIKIYSLVGEKQANLRLQSLYDISSIRGKYIA